MKTMEKKTYYITFDVYENGYVDMRSPKDIPVKLADEVGGSNQTTLPLR